MHRITASAGNWQPDAVGFIEQDPAPIVILTAADTDILAINPYSATRIQQSR